MRRLLSILILLSFQISFAGWGTPPEGWEDFDFGLLDSRRAPFITGLPDAVNAGIRIDHRYVYITVLSDIEGFIFQDWYNYATDGPKGIRPSITIYMLQQGMDDPGGQAALNSAADATYMKQYFEGVKTIAEKCKGTKPIFVLEPDVWGYLLGQANPEMNTANLSKICHINDLGLPWLEEFENRIDNLPAAIIKTLKMTDPNCYTGILMAHWGFPDDVSGAAADGKLSGEFVKKFLKEPYRGDFMGIEKNGTDAGSWSPTSSWHWDDTKNAAFVAWSKALGQEVDLPLFGWQISIGYKDEAGYDPLPNTNNRYTDTFFPYFFRHVDDWIDAGLIGFDAACNNQGFGTFYSMQEGVGDNGWFLDRLQEFNADRPYNLDLGVSPIETKSKTLLNNDVGVKFNRLVFSDNIISLNSNVSIKMFNSNGRVVSRLYSGDSMDLKDGFQLNLSEKLSAGAYWIKVSVRNKSYNIPYVFSK